MLKNISLPEITQTMTPVLLSEATMKQRVENIQTRMEQAGLDAVLIYADREHSGNFEYLTGFIPRFEEACLILHKQGPHFLWLGNENLKMANFSRLFAEAVHVPYFSLPNQPMKGAKPFSEYLKQSRLTPESKIGIVGWKLLHQDQEVTLYDLPAMIIDPLRQFVLDEQQLVPFADQFIAPGIGVRTQVNANEVAHYEYGATLSGVGVFRSLMSLAIGKTERDVAQYLAQEGQPNTVTTICATGSRFEHAELYPRDKEIQLGDRFSMTVGYRGGLSSRAGYVAVNEGQLPQEEQDYVARVAGPYFHAVATWLRHLTIGTTGDQLYQTIENVLPQADYGWSLNPGHLTAEEEWLSSPIYPKSTHQIQSGQLYQIDIIPKVAGYAGAGCEDPVLVADKLLQQEIQEQYPEVWQRLVRRKAYMQDVLGFVLPDEVFPMNDIVGYYTPYLLNHTYAFTAHANNE